MSVANIIDCLQKMVQAGFERLRDEQDLLVSTLTQLSKNCDQAIVLLQQYSIECGAEIFVSENSVDHVTGNDHVTSRYIRLVYWLLAKLNSTIKQEVDLFDARQSENLPSVKNEHTAPPLRPDVLSINHQSILAKVYQFVIALGVIPHLPAGVGVPVGTRSKFGHIVSSLVKPSKEHLISNVTELLELIQPSNVRSVFMAKHTGDLMAALAWLSQSHDTSSMSHNTSSMSHDTSSMSHDHSGDKEKASYFRQCLEDLLTRSYPPVIVKELLILQSAGRGKTPHWLRALCGYHLTKILVSPSGVSSIIAGMITVETDDWQQFKMVGRVIATPPRGWTAQRYYKLIAPQVLSLLTNVDHSISRQYSRVCAATMSCVSTAHPDLMRHLFWQPLTCDILSTSSDKQEVCLKTLCKIICLAAEPRSHLLPLCMQILPDIFSVYLQNKSSVVVTDTRLYCEELLSTCLQFSSNQSASKFLYDITTTSATLSADVLTAEDTRSAAILFCVSKVSESSVVQKFFIQLLEKLSSLMSDSTPDMVRTNTLIGGNNSPDLSGLLIKYRLMSLLSTLCETESKACLQHPQHIIKFVKASLTNFISCCENLSLSADCEVLSLSLGLLTAILSGASDVKLSKEDVNLLKDLDDPLNSISLLDCVPPDTRELALNIRVAIATQGLVWLNDQPQASSHKPSAAASEAVGQLVEEVKDTCVPFDASIQVPLSACQQVDTSQQVDTPQQVETSQQVDTPQQVDTSQQVDTPQQVDTSQHVDTRQQVDTSQQVDTHQQVDTLQQVDTSQQVDTLQQVDTSQLADTSQQVPADTAYGKALLELSDHLIAVKGHALIQITRLIQSKDKVTLDNRKDLVNLLVQHLAHSDTYIYLSAISGLVALADHCPSEVLSAACKQYTDNHLAAQTRLKVGEVITKATRGLGDLAPAYSDVVLPAVLIGCRSVDETLRASSLANLGELCKLLKYAMGNHVQEIVECLSACLVTSCQSSRKGSAYSISLILTELGSRSFEVLGAGNVSKLYKSLKSCIHSDNDEVTTHHCAVAIASLDAVVKKTLSGDSSGRLEKRIYVLDAPPSLP